MWLSLSCIGHNKENARLISSYLLIRRMKMETNKEITGREPPATGLAACLYRGTDVVYRSHINTKRATQLRTIHPLLLKIVKCHSRDCSPMALRYPLLKLWYYFTIRNYNRICLYIVRRGKDKKNLTYFIQYIKLNLYRIDY